MRASMLILSILLVGCGPKTDGSTDTDGIIVDDTDDTIVADTDVDDTDDTTVDDTDLLDTDTGVLDTDIADTDVVDTDVADTDVVDTDVVDTDIADTDVVDTDVADTDTGATDTDPVILVDSDSDGTVDALDCAPNDSAIHPGAAEVCDGVDNNCAGGVDDGLPTFTYYLDDDGDGFGDVGMAVISCQAPADHVLDATDCDDSEGARFPGAPELCGQELDCNPSTVAVCATRFSDVHPIFRSNCTPCHSTGGSGGHNIASSNISTAYTQSQRSSTTSPGHTVGYASLVRVRNGSMPAGGGCTGNPVTDAGHAACLTASEQASLQAWLDDGQLQ